MSGHLLPVWRLKDDSRSGWEPASDRGGNPGVEGKLVIGPSGIIRVMVATKPVDFRKGAEDLAALVRDSFAGPQSKECILRRVRRRSPAVLPGRGLPDLSPRTKKGTTEHEAALRTIGFHQTEAEQ